MRKLLIVLILGLVLRLPVVACLDFSFFEAATRDPLQASQTVNPGDVFYDQPDAYWEEEAAKWKEKWQAESGWRDGVNYAVCLAMVGDYPASLAQLEEVETVSPGQYATAVSLATLYELRGEYRLALGWMERAYRMNPDARYGCEWIHYNILWQKASSKGQDFGSNDLIRVHFGEKNQPAVVLSNTERDRLAAQVFLILDQRVFLIPDKDSYSAQLMFDLGNMNLLRQFPTACLDNYEFAKALGFQGELIERRAAEVIGATYVQPAPTYAQARPHSPPRAKEYERIIVAMVITFIIVVVVGMVILLIVSRKRASANSKEPNFEDLFDDQN